MTKLILLTFMVLGVVFYEMSGGSDFEPELRAPVAVAETKLAPVAPTEPQVARADTSSLIQIPAPVVETQQPEAVVETVAFTAPLPAGEVIITPAPQVVEEDTVEIAAPVVEAPRLDLRTVAGDWVNMRSGPSTDYRVLDTLPRGTEAGVVEVNADGWARIVIMSTGQEGWMAERLLNQL